MPARRIESRGKGARSQIQRGSGGIREARDSGQSAAHAGSRRADALRENFLIQRPRRAKHDHAGAVRQLRAGTRQSKRGGISMIKRFTVLIIGIALCLLTTPRSTVQAAPTYPPKSGDPCSINMRSVVPINLTASGQIAAGVANKYTYICSVHLVTATAQNIALVEGTGSTCGTSTAGMAGGATAATGWNLAVNQSLRSEEHTSELQS